MHKWFVLILVSLFTTSFAHSAACPASSDSTTAGNGTCDVSGTLSTIQLNFNSGFDDSTAISAVGGNNGTTVGAQRKLSFIKAAEILADKIASSVTIIVDADFSALSCDAGSAVLGSAGATTNTGNVSPAPADMITNTFYPIGLINAMGSQDYQAGLSDVTAQFNSDLGDADCLSSSNGWYYGYDTPPANYIGFTTVLLHEVTHGLGFASLVDPSTGAKASGLDDIFSNHLYDNANSRNWNDASETNTNRANSAVSGTGLLWSGTNVNTQAIGVLTDGFQDNDSSGTFTAGDRVEMYAPNPVESGSSISHFNTDASPNELMEPQYTEGSLDIGLALYLLEDIGWDIAANTAPTITAVDQSTNEDTAKVVDMSSWGSDGDGDSLTYSVTSCPSNITCGVSGSNITLTPDANYNGATNSVTVQVSDGNGGTASDSFNLTVTAVDDAPTWSAIPDQNVTEGGSSVAIDLSAYVTDVDGDSITGYSVVTCGSGLDCSNLSGSTLNLSAVSNGGATVTVTVRADEGDLTTDQTFNVNIASPGNNAPVLTALDQVTDEDVDLVIDISSWASDLDGDSLTYSVSSCSANISCSIIGSSLTLSPDANHNGNTHTITLAVSDGNGGSDTDSFNLVVNAVNDAPNLNPVDQSTNEDTALVVDISSWGSDIEGDTITYEADTNCATGITCSISGNSLTLTPDENHNGTTHTITIIANDGNTGTASANFNLNVNPVNDAPALAAISDLTQFLNTTEEITLNGSDVDGDSLSYSVTGSSNAGASITGSILKLVPIAAGTYNLDVTVTDGTLTDSQSFTVTVISAPPLALNGVALTEDNPVIIEHSDVSLVLADGVTDYQIDLTFEGQSASSLLTLSGTSITIALPDPTDFNGQFAGEYVLTLTQLSSGAVSQYSLMRTPRLTFSATKFLGGTERQTMTIEGGTSNSVYTLTNDTGEVGFLLNQTSVTAVTAVEDNSNFNPATVVLDIETVSSLTTSTILVESIYETVNRGLDLYPQSPFELTVEDEQGNRLTDSSARVDSPDLTDFNLPESYPSNSLGVIVLGLPNEGDDFSVSVGQTLFTTKEVILQSSQLEQTVVLTKIATPLTLKGDIEALTPLTFEGSLPSVTLTLLDGSTIDIEVVKLSNGLARFEYVHDLNIGSVNNLLVEHEDAVGLSFNIPNLPGTVTFDVFLESNTQSPTLNNDDATEIGSSSGGSLGLSWLILLAIWLYRLPRHMGCPLSPIEPCEPMS